MSHHYHLNFDELPDSAFIRLNHLISARVAPFSRATVWRMVKAGRFPTPTKLSENITAWNVGAVRRWQSSVLANSEVGRNRAGEAA